MIVRTIAVVVIITTPPPSALAQMMFMYVSDEFRSIQSVVFSDLSLVRQVKAGFMQSSSVKESIFVGQVGSTVYTVPVTVMNDPLLTHSERKATKSSAVLTPIRLV